MPDPWKGTFARHSQRWLWALGLLLLVVAAVAAACGGNGGQAPQAGQTPAATEMPNGGTTIEATSLQPVVLSSDLALGENRFVLGLLSQDNEVILDAQVKLRFFKLDGDEAELRSEAETRHIKLREYEGNETGVYVTNVTFDTPGDWAVEAIATVSGRTLDASQSGFTVAEKSQTPAVGEPVPITDNPTIYDVDNIFEIDSSDPARTQMHRLSIADAVTSGRPSVIAFATPAFCISRICGPDMDIVDQVFDRYSDRVNFVHVEPWKLEPLRVGQGFEPVEATLEWGLCREDSCSEPWVFVVDRQGKLAAKFEAMVATQEIESALQQTLGSGGSSTRQ